MFEPAASEDEVLLHRQNEKLSGMWLQLQTGRAYNTLFNKASKDSLALWAYVLLTALPDSQAAATGIRNEECKNWKKQLW